MGSRSETRHISSYQQRSSQIIPVRVPHFGTIRGKNHLLQCLSAWSSGQSRRLIDVCSVDKAINKHITRKLHYYGFLRVNHWTKTQVLRWEAWISHMLTMIWSFLDTFVIRILIYIPHPRSLFSRSLFLPNPARDSIFIGTLQPSDPPLPSLP